MGLSSRYDPQSRMSAVELLGMARFMSRRLFASEANMWVNSVKSELEFFFSCSVQEKVAIRNRAVCQVDRWRGERWLVSADTSIQRME